MKNLAVFLMMVLSYASVQAQPLRSDFVSVLVPVVPGSRLPGAGGSVWETELRIRNLRNGPVGFAHGEAFCNVAACPQPYPYTSLEPLADVFWSLDSGEYPLWRRRPGILLYIERQFLSDVAMSLHVRNVGTSATSWGDEVPLVFEDSLRSKVVLLNVPLIRGEYRTMLRLYDAAPTPDGGAAVVVRIYAQESNDSLLETIIGLVPPMGDADWWLEPAYAEISAMEEMPELVGRERIRIEVESLSTSSRIWAMASVTSNVTQAFSVVSPQPR